MLVLLCVLGFILSANSALAPFIKPCKTGDTPCILAAARAALPFVVPGIPELGMKSMDPLFMPLIKSDQGGLKLTFKDTVLTGMKGCTIESIKHDLTKKQASAVSLKCNIELNGDYKLGGNLLILPVNGNGKYKIILRDMIIKTYSELVTVPGADGERHWHINKWRHSFDVKTGAHFEFENLFNGNKVLADPVLEFANTNWRDVMQEIAPPIVHAIVSEVVDAVEALYKAVPAKHLELTN